MNSFALLTRADRESVLRDAQIRLDIPPFIVEKDFWVCWTLARIFSDAEIANTVLFKGGTSLSKVFRVIDRFSEDVDLGVAPVRLGFDEQQLNESPSKTRRQRDMDAQPGADGVGGPRLHRSPPALQAVSGPGIMCHPRAPGVPGSPGGTFQGHAIAFSRGKRASARPCRRLSRSRPQASHR